MALVVGGEFIAELCFGEDGFFLLFVFFFLTLELISAERMRSDNLGLGLLVMWWGLFQCIFGLLFISATCGFARLEFGIGAFSGGNLIVRRCFEGGLGLLDWFRGAGRCSVSDGECLFIEKADGIENSFGGLFKRLLSVECCSIFGVSIFFLLFLLTAGVFLELEGVFVDRRVQSFNGIDGEVWVNGDLWGLSFGFFSDSGIFGGVILAGGWILVILGCGCGVGEGIEASNGGFMLFFGGLFGFLSTSEGLILWGCGLCWERVWLGSVESVEIRAAFGSAPTGRTCEAEGVFIFDITLSGLV